MFGWKQAEWFTSKMEEQIVRKKDLANNFYQHLIIMYEMFTFPAAPEISDLDSIGSCEKVRLPQVFFFILSLMIPLFLSEHFSVLFYPFWNGRTRTVQSVKDSHAA